MGPVYPGVAEAFATRVTKLMRHAKSPQDAVRKAGIACRNAASKVDPIPLEDGSLDFITSSMVASQFDWEPYNYFSKLLEEKFGRDTILAQEEALLPKVEELRSELFRAQMGAHVREMYRLVEKERGAVYFSVELFRSVPESDLYFLVQEIPSALEALGKHFYFDFSMISPHRALKTSQVESGISVIQCYVLRPRPAALAARG